MWIVLRFNRKIYYSEYKDWWRPIYNREYLLSKHRDQVKFLDDTCIYRVLVSMEVTKNSKTFIAGDWNIVQDMEVDKVGGAA